MPKNSKLQLANNTIAVVVIDDKVFTTKQAASNYCSVMYDMDDVEFLEFLKGIENVPTYGSMRTILGVVEHRMVTIAELDKLISDATDWYLT